MNPSIMVRMKRADDADTQKQNDNCESTQERKKFAVLFGHRRLYPCKSTDS
jgi:hypothetical protein